MLILQPILSSAATVAVDKATSELLNSPDWSLNIDICDTLNSNPWKRKEIVKALKRRLQHSSSRVQLLALTLLETMVKNCGDYVHCQIDERSILGEMIKIVKKKADLRVRVKILVLLDSWQETFGGRKGEHPQYYWAYQELRRSGVSFPERPPNAVPIVTPPAKHHPGCGMPSNSSRRLDETIATETECVSLSSLDSIKDVIDLLGDMLQAVNPRDPMSVKDELIVDLVNQCRSSQKKLMQTLTNAGDEKILGRGLELNDGLQSLLAKHDAIATGSPLAVQFTTSVGSKPTEANTVDKSNQVKNSSPKSSISPPASVPIVTGSLIDDDEEEEEDFAQLTRRHWRAESRSSQSTSAAGTNESLMPINDTIVTTSYEPPDTATDDLCKALALPSDSAAQVKNTKEQDMIDLLSLTLSDSSPSANHQNMHHQVQVQPPFEGYTSYGSQNYPECHGPQGPMPYDSYIVPWAQAQVQSQPQSFLQPQYSSGYPLPQWTNNPGYFTGRSQVSSANNNMFSNQNPNATSSNTMIERRPLQHSNSYPVIGGSNGTTINADYFRTPVLAEKPYIPPYRLFEDLNVLENGNGRLKMKSSASSQSMVGLRK